MDLTVEIESLLNQDAPDFQISKLLKQAIKEYLDNLEEIFKETQGKAFFVHHTRKIDYFLSIIYKVVLRKMFREFQPMRNSVPIALVALGSYGREQLCVYSDIDLMIVYKEIPGYNIREIIEKILYIAWDAGFQLGHRVHEIAELSDVAEEDITIKTALMESRFIIGSNFIWMETQRELGLIRRKKPKEYVLSKLEEAEARHTKHPVTMEPNIKECVGGIRDANLAFWIASVRHHVSRLRELVGGVIDEADYAEYRSALEFIFRVRSALHLSAKKKEDTLRLELVPNVTDLLGIEKRNPQKAQKELVTRTLHSLDIIRKKSSYWVGLLSRPYLFDARHIPLLKKEMVEPGIFRCQDTLYARRNLKPRTFLSYLKLLLKEAARFPVVTDASFEHLIDRTEVPKSKGKQLTTAIRQIFYLPYSASVIKALYRSGKLPQTIPPMKRIMYLPQFDGYHHYPVDLHSYHTLLALDNLRHELLKPMFEGLDRDSRAMLKLVALLHDAGKGRIRDHRDVGADLFKIYAKKLGLGEELIKEGILLIRHHTRMTYTIHNEDIYDESTVSRFVAPLSNRKLLDMLFILTYCDVNAVGENVYNAFTERMLKTLYFAAVEMLEKPAIIDETAKRLRREHALRRILEFKELPRSLQKKILSIESNLFFIKHSTKEILDIAKRARTVLDYDMQITAGETLKIEIYRKIPINLGYLLGKLSHLELVTMEIFKLFDGVKYFVLEFNDTIADEEIPMVEQIIHDSFDMNKKIKLKKPLIKPREITIDCEHTKTYALMQIKTANQRGLMAYVAHYFDELGIDIATAVITTRKDRVNDLFLIEKNGKFCENRDLIVKKLTDSSSHSDHSKT
ncbi:HD domain-containing protein [Hydrogenimonas urashimensis]|uniref:[protein-PII] uridylyltransferase family protein n=1 Tax=Hydrogenimonas urashimensis TaxID=2740515 RepID=UPI00191676DA|nr:HD domain-containing protein [Hydrogenimonas urashimensis]